MASEARRSPGDRTDAGGDGRRRRRAVALLVAWTLGLGVAEGASLRGSRGSMVRQSEVATRNGFVRIRTATEVKRLVAKETLVRVSGNRDLEIDGAAFPYARPQVRSFVRQLAHEYRRACGEPLVVTSLTRPLSHQPRNASKLSVHPAGLAVDIRRSRRSKCRKWLEAKLLRLEKSGVVDATRERRPPHYHVAVFPRRYERSLEATEAKAVVVDATAPAAADVRPVSAGMAGDVRRVRRGDTLWSIARELRVSVRALRDANGLRSSRLRPGQVLRVPVLEPDPEQAVADKPAASKS